MRVQPSCTEPWLTPAAAPVARLRPAMGPSVFSATDAVAVAACTGVVLCLCSTQGEAGIIGAIIFALIVSLRLSLAAQRLPASIASIPWLSVSHFLFWTMLTLYEFGHFYANPHYLDERVIMVHKRNYTNSYIFSCTWVVMGFFAGFYPAPATVKLQLFAAACLSISSRLVMLAKAWEQLQPDEHTIVDHAGHERSLVKLLVDNVIKGGPTDGPSRLSVELLLGGFSCLIGAAFLGLSLGIFMRAKFVVIETLQTQLGGELDAYREEHAELLRHAYHVESARRRTLLEAKARELQYRRVLGQKKGGRLYKSALRGLDEENDSAEWNPPKAD